MCLRLRRRPSRCAPTARRHHTREKPVWSCTWTLGHYGDHEPGGILASPRLLTASWSNERPLTGRTQESLAVIQGRCTLHHLAPSYRHGPPQMGRLLKGGGLTGVVSARLHGRQNMYTMHISAGFWGGVPGALMQAKCADNPRRQVNGKLIMRRKAEPTTKQLSAGVDVGVGVACGCVTMIKLEQRRRGGMT